MAGQNCGDKIWYINSGVRGLDLSSLPRCQAIASTTGKRCKRPARKNTDRCGIHSGRFRPGAPIGNTRGFVHGRYSGQFHKNLAKGKSLADRMERQISNITKILQE